MPLTGVSAAKAQAWTVPQTFLLLAFRELALDKLQSGTLFIVIGPHLSSAPSRGGCQ